MQLLKHARKIHNGSSVQIENSLTRVTVWHHKACLLMPKSYPLDGIFNQHLTTIKDSYIPWFINWQVSKSIPMAALRDIY